MAHRTSKISNSKTKHSFAVWSCSIKLKYFELYRKNFCFEVPPLLTSLVNLVLRRGLVSFVNVLDLLGFDHVRLLKACDTLHMYFDFPGKRK